MSRGLQWSVSPDKPAEGNIKKGVDIDSKTQQISRADTRWGGGGEGEGGGPAPA